MQFFEQQRLAKRNTLVLVVLFAFAVIVVSYVLGYCLTQVVFLNSIVQSRHGIVAEPSDRLRYQLTFFVGFVILLVTTFQLLMARSGDSLAQDMGGVIPNPNTQDLKEKQYLNIVEEMAIASGIRVPHAYILKSDNSINAFAVGEDPQMAVVAITEGALQSLTRDELQAVIGHEFSHILNEDMKLNMRMWAVLSGLVFISKMGQMFIEKRTRVTFGRSSDESIGMIRIGAVFLFIIGGLGVILARMIQAAVSRQREFLADAASAQFTRNPDALSQALVKIKFFSGSIIHSKMRFEMAHVFFADAVDSVFSFFATHPSVMRRIQALSPRFNVDQFLTELKNNAQMKPHSEKVSQEIMKKPLDGALFLQKASLLEAIGQPRAEQLTRSEKLLKEIPPPILQGARSLVDAKAIVMGCVLSQQENKLRATALAGIGFLNPQQMSLCEQALNYTDQNHESLMPLLQISVAKVLQREELEIVLHGLRNIFELDQKITLTEALTYAYVQTFSGVANTQNKTLKSVQIYYEKLLWWFLTQGRSFADLNEEEKLNYKTQYLNILFQWPFTPNPAEKFETCDLESIQAVAVQLKQVNLVEKKKLVEMLWRCVQQSNKNSSVTPQTSSVQFENMRLACGLFGIPVPLILL